MKASDCGNETILSRLKNVLINDESNSDASNELLKNDLILLLSEYYNFDKNAFKLTATIDKNRKHIVRIELIADRKKTLKII